MAAVTGSKRLYRPCSSTSPSEASCSGNFFKMSSYRTWAKSMGTSIASRAATVEELKFSEPLALRLACSIVLRAT